MSQDAPAPAPRSAALGALGAWLAAAGNVVLATAAVVGFATPGGPGAIVSRLVDQRWLILGGLVAQGVGLVALAASWIVGGTRPVDRAAGAVWLGYVALATAFVIGYVGLAPFLLPVVLGATVMLLAGCVLAIVTFAGARGELRGTLQGAGASLAVWAFSAVAALTLVAAVLLGSERWEAGLLALAALGLAGAVALAAAGIALLRPPHDGGT